MPIFETDEDNVKGKASRELDVEYLSAVENGDMKTAQKMVDQAAKKAGYIRWILSQKSYYNLINDHTNMVKKQTAAG